MGHYSQRLTEVLFTHAHEEKESDARRGAERGAQQLLRPASLPRLLVVDDDPSYGKIIQRLGNREGLDITVCHSIDELGGQTAWDFDVAIIDYDLGVVTGVELTRYLEEFCNNLPVILVSQTSRSLNRGSPDSIRNFVHKGLGPYAVLDAALEAHEVARIHKKMRQRGDRGEN